MIRSFLSLALGYALLPFRQSGIPLSGVSAFPGPSAVPNGAFQPRSRSRSVAGPVRKEIRLNLPRGSDRASVSASEIAKPARKKRRNGSRKG